MDYLLPILNSACWQCSAVEFLTVAVPDYRGSGFSWWCWRISWTHSLDGAMQERVGTLIAPPTSALISFSGILLGVYVMNVAYMVSFSMDVLCWGVSSRICLPVVSVAGFRWIFSALPAGFLIGGEFFLGSLIVLYETWCGGWCPSFLRVRRVRWWWCPWREFVL